MYYKKQLMKRNNKKSPHPDVSGLWGLNLFDV